MAVDGGDIESNIEITVEEGFKGCEKKVSLNVSGSKKTLSFKVPSGVADGARIKLTGQGHPGINGGKDGNLYLVVRLIQGKFILEKENLVSSLKLAPWEAALGSEVKFQTLDGKILVKVPPGIQSGNRIRVAQKGYQSHGGMRGDLYLKVDIVNPPILTPTERELYERLRKESNFIPLR
jgi:curved DNA-binding protein